MNNLIRQQKKIVEHVKLQALLPAWPY